MGRSFRASILISAIALTSSNAFAIDSVEGALDEKITPILDQVMETYGIPGLCVAVVDDGRIAYSRAPGVKNITTGEKMTTRSLFHMASVTKPFVASSLMQLVERGKIDLDAPVVRYLPYFQIDDKESDKITIRQMLRHTSGMPDVNDYEWDRPVYDDGALERYVRSLGGQRLIAPSGTRHRYSNMAFEVLGDVIAKVSGMSFEDHVAKYILEPLGMMDTTLLKKKASPELLTTPHVTGKNSQATVSEIYPYNRMHAPSSTLISNLPDLARWTLANLNRGELEGARILKESSYELLFKANDTKFTNIGLSWFLGSHGEVPIVYHGGSDVGYLSSVTLIPKTSQAVIVMSNYSGAPLGQIVRTILDVTLGRDPVPIYKPLQKLLLAVIESRGAEAAVSRYHRLKRGAGQSYDFGENTLVGLGKILLGQKRFDEAKQILELNLEQYPTSWTSLEALGDVLSKQGDTKTALDQYQKAHEMNPDSARLQARINQLRAR